MSGFIISLVAAIFVVIAAWLKYKSNLANQDRLRRELAEQKADSFKEGLKASQEASKAHEKVLIELVQNNISDERASELLSRPVTNPKIPSTKPTKT